MLRHHWSTTTRRATQKKLELKAHNLRKGTSKRERLVRLAKKERAVAEEAALILQSPARIVGRAEVVSLKVVRLREPGESPLGFLIVPYLGGDEMSEPFAEADRIPFLRAYRIRRAVLVLRAAVIRAYSMAQAHVRLRAIVSIIVIAVVDCGYSVSKLMGDDEFEFGRRSGRVAIFIDSSVAEFDVVTPVGDIIVRITIMS